MPKSLGTLVYGDALGRGHYPYKGPMGSKGPMAQQWSPCPILVIALVLWQQTMERCCKKFSFSFYEKDLERYLFIYLF